MEADVSDPGSIEESAQIAIEVRGIDRPYRRRCEDKASVLSAFCCRLTFCFLTFTVFLA